MPLSVALTILAVFTAGVALIIAGWRARRVAAATVVAEPAGMPDAAEAISQRIEALLNDHERRLTEAFADVREDLSGLKTDGEWLAGERMIEQAIALAQTGSDPDDIGQELGLSRDQAATIAMFRKH